MRPLRLDGKVDAEALISVAEHLHTVHGIERQRILTDWFLYSDSEYQNIQISTAFGLETVETACILHRPDIMIRQKDVWLPELIIEVDGSVHDTKPGRKKTEKRNADYRDLGIPCIVLNLADIKILGETWREYLDKQLKKIHIKP